MGIIILLNVDFQYSVLLFSAELKGTREWKGTT